MPISTNLVLIFIGTPCILTSEVQGDYSELVAEMGEDVLPVEYGGSNGTCEDIQGDSLNYKIT